MHRSRLRSHTWLPVAYCGVTLLVILSAAWNFSHAVVLAGGENPLILLEGRWPTWSGIAIGIGLASIGSDLVKTVSGFVLGSAIVNPTLKWRMRVVAICVASLLCVPTFLWSARSALGMASLAFGDAIAARGADHLIGNAIEGSMESRIKRLQWLDEQKTCTGRTCKMHAKEAATLRAELAGDRTELRNARHVGAGDPGSQVISDLTGYSSHRITSLTIGLFILMVELGSTFGYPCLALVTRVSKREEETSEGSESGGNEKKKRGGNDSGPSGNLNGHNENPEPRSNVIGFPKIPASADAIRAQEEIAAAVSDTDSDDAADDADGEEADDQENLKSPRRGRRTMATVKDGHVEKYVDHCEATKVRPDAASYRAFCWGQLGKQPMGTKQMWKEIKKYQKTPRRIIGAMFDRDDDGTRKRDHVNGLGSRVH